MDPVKFSAACQTVYASSETQNGIGTLNEKTLHAVLKHYFEPCTDCHEVKIGAFVADIAGENGIIEIQTRQFDKLRKKLTAFLPAARVTVVYPIAKTKQIIWIDEETGEHTKKRKAPKSWGPHEILRELYKIKPLLKDENLRFCMVLLEIDEYRRLNGWSADRKKGASRYERIPTALADELYIDCPGDYALFLPETLPAQFTSKDYQKATAVSLSLAQTALNILVHVGVIVRVGKLGRLNLYEKI